MGGDWPVCRVQIGRTLRVQELQLSNKFPMIFRSKETLVKQ